MMHHKNGAGMLIRIDMVISHVILIHVLYVSGLFSQTLAKVAGIWLNYRY